MPRGARTAGEANDVDSLGFELSAAQPAAPENEEHDQNDRDDDNNGSDCHWSSVPSWRITDGEDCPLPSLRSGQSMKWRA